MASWMGHGIVCILAVVAWATAKPTTNNQIDLLMPDVQPVVNDTYLCTPMQVQEDAMYITGFVPHGDMNIAHHILIYGCEEPGRSTEGEAWNCGEMSSSTVEQDSKYEQAQVCASGAKIIYAWAMDAPDLHLPEGVAFKVGRDSSIKTLVLQVHYKNVKSFLPPLSKTDHSGVSLITTLEPQPKTAGVYLMGTGGSLAPNSTVFMETACTYNDPMVLHPFAFRTHAHVHGQVVSGYRVHDGQWEEIGRKSPQQPQMFYSVTHPGMTIQPGDVLAARCTMVNNENRVVKVGQTQNDEMCNFYIMYWTEGDQDVKDPYCFTPGPPAWNWSNFGSELGFENMPDDISLEPDTKQLFKQTQKMIEDAEEEFDNIDNAIREKFMALLGNLDMNGLDEQPEENEYYPQEYDPRMYPSREEQRLMEEYRYREPIPQRAMRDFGYRAYDDMEPWMAGYP